MGILDQLVEKKDLSAYLHFRTTKLQQNKNKFDNVRDSKKEMYVKSIEGKINELLNQ